MDDTRNMEHPGFFKRAEPLSLAELAAKTGVACDNIDDTERVIEGVRPLSDAGPNDVSFLDNKKYLPQLGTTKAGACFVKPAFADRVPAKCTPLITKTPYHAFAMALQTLYPDAMTPKIASHEPGTPPVDPTAQFEDGVVIEPGAIVGPDVRIGQDSVIAAGAVIGARVYIGRNCYIGANATIAHTLIGNNVIVHAGVRTGQDGFGFAMGPQGHLKVPQIGRVIIQDNVEIGANTTIDRGALSDTIIGEGTKIDNLVQIGHNVIMGRHCVIVSQTGISGSTELGDFVVMGGQSGTVGHIKVGTGAQIAGTCHPKDDVPPGARMGGTPGRPLRQWAKEVATLTRLARSK